MIYMVAVICYGAGVVTGVILVCCAAAAKNREAGHP